MIVNVSGREFVTRWKNFLRFPNTRLGRIFQAISVEEILLLCDGFLPGDPPIIFFFRNPVYFQTILDAYRADMNEMKMFINNKRLLILSGNSTKSNFRFSSLEKGLSANI